MIVVTGLAVILITNSMQAREISVSIVRPTTGENLTIRKGATFVIGTISPPQTKLMVNGVAADVSSDGAFIAMAPIQILEKAKTIEVARGRRKRVDAAFDFVATSGTNTWKRQILVSTPSVTAEEEPPLRVFSKPQPFLVTKEQILSQTATTNWGLLCLPKGTCVMADARRDTRLRLMLGNKQETWVGQDALQRVKSPPAVTAIVAMNVSPLETHFEVGAIVPYGIEQVLSPPKLNVTFYCPDQPRSFAVTLSSPQPWGFSARYESNTLVVEQKPAPDLASGLKGRTICLDPGHNPDTGAVGPRGFKEREANLKIGLALEKLLTTAGAKVVFTHRHEPMPLPQRRPAALVQNPDIFVSLHNNSMPDGTDPRTNFGTSTLYYHPQSRALADAVHASMLATLGWPDQKVQQKSLAVCRTSEFPAILVEPAYIILPDQEKFLMSEAGQQKIAKAIFAGIKIFFESKKM